VHPARGSNSNMRSPFKVLLVRGSDTNLWSLFKVHPALGSGSNTEPPTVELLVVVRT
jgi:hypothetical protein